MPPAEIYDLIVSLTLCLLTPESVVFGFALLGACVLRYSVHPYINQPRIKDCQTCFRIHWAVAAGALVDTPFQRFISISG